MEEYVASIWEDMEVELLPPKGLALAEAHGGGGCSCGDPALARLAALKPIGKPKWACLEELEFLLEEARRLACGNPLQTSEELHEEPKRA